MPEHNVRGLEYAIYLKSNLLRRLAASPLEEWPPHLTQFVTRLEANLQNATALVVLLADLREQIRVLIHDVGQNATAAAVDERALMRMSSAEVVAWFRGELRALVAQARPVVGPRSRIVEEAVHFIERHYAEPLTIETIANAVGTSKRHLATLFRRQMEQGVHQYLTHVRLHHSMALIREGQKIEAVSLMVGYRSRKNFYRHFRAALGMTPLTYKITCLQR
jgi:AraC-like DNA-binding protein